MTDNKKVSLYGPIDTPETCFLWEVRDWRALGRCPTEQSWDDKPWRESGECRDGFTVSTSAPKELSPEECSFAGISVDPSWLLAMEDCYIPSVEDAQLALDNVIKTGLKGAYVEYLEEQLESAKRFAPEREKWIDEYTDYVDQFEAEIILDLRRGKLKAFGTVINTKLKNVIEENGSYYEQFLVGTPENPIQIARQGDGPNVESFDWASWYEFPPIVQIPPEAWVSERVNWSVSSVIGRKISYIWVHLKFDEVLEAYPPSLLLDPTKTFAIGDNLAVVGVSQGPQSTKKGRPPLPWERFHVEVTRRYIDGDMPEKKDAAIAALQEWFEIQMGQTVGRSTIGEKLKPYFDTLHPKDRK